VIQLTVLDTWLESNESRSWVPSSSTSTFTSTSHDPSYIFSLFLFYWGDFAAVGSMVWKSFDVFGCQYQNLDQCGWENQVQRDVN
jgi:hypothetical protein